MPAPRPNEPAWWGEVLRLNAGGERCAWAAYEKLEFVWRTELPLLVR
jgi:hypothetical protein